MRRLAINNGAQTYLLKSAVAGNELGWEIQKALLGRRLLFQLNDECIEASGIAKVARRSAQRAVPRA